MSPGFKSSLAALAVAGLLLSPVITGASAAYADDTSTSTVQTDSPSDDQAKADKAAADKKAEEAKKQAEADAAAAKQKADAEAQAKADQEAKQQAQKEADAKKAADEASTKAEATPSADASPTAPADPPSQEAVPASSSPSPTAQVAAKVASTKTVTYNAVETYVTKITLCGAGGVDIKAGAPDIKAKGPGDADAATYKAGDELRWNTSASSIDVYLAIADDSSNNTTLTIAVKQGEECKTEVTPKDPTQAGNVVTIPDVNGVIYRDQDGNYLDPGDHTITKDTTVKAEADQFFKLPAGEWSWTFKYQAPDADGDGYTDAEEQAAGSDPNDPKSTPVDLDGDGVLNDADKCANTAANAKVDKDGCSADQLGTQPDETFPQDPKYNNASYWETYFGDGAYCIKYDPASTPFTVPSAPAGYSWFSAIVKAGAGDAANELYNGIKPGDKLVHSSGKNISHVILCKRAVATQYKYGTGLYIYKKLDPSKPAGWENSDTQRFVTSKEGSSDQGWFTSIPKLPDYVCGPGWGWQQDKQKVNKDATIVWPDTINYPVDNIGWPPIYDAKHGEMSDLGVEVPDCTTYYDAPTIQAWDQKCVVGDQGVGQYTDGGFVVTAADKVSVVVKDGDDKVVTDTSSVKPGVYTVFATAPKGGAWNELPDGWSYVDESKTVIKTVVTVNAAKDCSVQKPPPDPSTYVWGQETWKCYDTQAVTKGERIDYVPTWIDGAWVQVAQPPVPVEKTRPLTEEEIVGQCLPDSYFKYTETDKVEDGWFCGDTFAVIRWQLIEWRVDFELKWLEDGNYTFVEKAAVEVSREDKTDYRNLTDEEIITNCLPAPYFFTTETEEKKGDWKCGDTTVTYTWWLIEWRVDFELKWLEDGSYTFVEKDAVETGRDEQFRTRPLTDKELAPCNNGGDSGPENGESPATPWLLAISLVALGGASLYRWRRA